METRWMIYTSCKDHDRDKQELLKQLAPYVQKQENTPQGTWLYSKDGSRIWMEHHNDTVFMQEQIEGMYAFYAQVPCTDGLLKQRILRQVAAFRSVIALQWDASAAASWQAAMYQMMRVCHGIGVDEQMSLYAPDGTLLLSVTGEHANTDFYPVRDDERLACAQEQLEWDSFQHLQQEFAERGWQVPAYMEREQLYLDEWQLPDEERILQRALALFALSAYCQKLLCDEEDASQQAHALLTELIDKWQIDYCFEQGERSFLQKPQVDTQKALELAERMECAQLLFWTIGIVDLPAWDVPCTQTRLMTQLQTYTSYEAMKQQAQLRALPKLYACYLFGFYAERLCWQSVLYGTLPDGLHEDVIWERQRSLRWLCGGCVS